MDHDACRTCLLIFGVVCTSLNHKLSVPENHCARAILRPVGSYLPLATTYLATLAAYPPPPQPKQHMFIHS